MANKSIQQTMVDELNLFRTDEDYPSYVIARNAQEVIDFYRKEYGEECYLDNLREFKGPEEEFASVFVKGFDRDYELTVFDEDGSKETKTVGQWIEDLVKEGTSFPYLFGVFEG